MRVQTPKPGWGYQSGRGQGQLKQITEQGREQGRDRVSFPFPFPTFPYTPFPCRFCADVHDRRDHYLMWEVIDYGYTPRYKKAVSKFEAVSNYNIEVSWNGGKWGVAFKVTEAYLNAAEGAAMLYKETGNGEFQMKAQALLDKLRVKRFSAAAFVSTDISAADELIAFVRDERRRELCFENHRWFDLRRYGMEEIKHVWYDASGNSSEYVLEKNDPGFTLQLPNEAFEYNSGLEQNEPRK